jgi:hypothetical protein
MRLVIDSELFSRRVVFCCWLADHALAVTCTDGLGLGLGLIRPEETRWRRCGTCCSGVVLCSKTILLPIQYTLFQRRDKQNSDHSFFISFTSRLANIYSITSTVPLVRSPQSSTQPSNHSAHLPFHFHSTSLSVIYALNATQLFLHSPQREKRGRSLPVPESAKCTPSHGFFLCLLPDLLTRQVLVMHCICFLPWI